MSTRRQTPCERILDLMVEVAKERGMPLLVEKEMREFRVVSPDGVKHEYELNENTEGFGSRDRDCIEDFPYTEADDGKPTKDMATRILVGAMQDMLVKATERLLPKPQESYEVSASLQEDWTYTSGLEVQIKCQGTYVEYTSAVAGDGWPEQAQVLECTQRGMEVVEARVQQVQALKNYARAQLEEAGFDVEETKDVRKIQVNSFFLSAEDGEKMQITHENSRGALDIKQVMKLLQIADRCTVVEMRKGATRQMQQETEIKQPMTSEMDLV